MIKYDHTYDNTQAIIPDQSNSYTQYKSNDIKLIPPNDILELAMITKQLCCPGSCCNCKHKDYCGFTATTISIDADTSDKIIIIDHDQLHDVLSNISLQILKQFCKKYPDLAKSIYSMFNIFIDNNEV